MSDLLDERPVMPPQISPKDIPRGGENSDSEEDEPIPPVILENSSSSDEDADNMEDEEEDVNQGYVQLAQDESEDQQTTEESSPQVLVKYSLFLLEQKDFYQLYDLIYAYMHDVTYLSTHGPGDTKTTD